jgi:peptide/nickel transport system substrate-binding protein
MKKIICIFIAAIFFFTACSSAVEDGFVLPEVGAGFDYEELPFSPDPRLPVAYESETGNHDNTLRLSMRPPKTLNPLLNTDPTVAMVLGLIFEPLAVLDEELRVTGHLAQLDFSLDYTSVLVTIPSHAIWSDGLPVNADDLIFSVNTLRAAPENAVYRTRADNIASITRENDRTVRIFFTEATPAAGYSLLFPIIPRHYYLLETNPASRRNLSPLGNGPYMFEHLIPMQSLSMVRNVHSFRTVAEIERVLVLFLPDATIDLYAFDRGLVDAVRLPMPEWARNSFTKEITGHNFTAMYFEFIGFNYERAIFNQTEVRQGIAQVFDINDAIETLYLHHAVRAATPVHPSAWFADSRVSGFSYNRLRARVLLRDVPRAPDTPPWVIIVSENSPERTAIARRLAAALEELDIKTQVLPLSEADFNERLQQGEYDLFIGWVQMCFTPAYSFLFPWDGVLEGMFTTTRAAATESAFLHAHSQFQHAFAERVPVLGLAFRHSSLLMGGRIDAPAPPSPTNLFLHVNQWQIR